MERENKNSTWRIVQNSCWTQIPLGQHGTIANPTPNFALVPCDESECCVVGIKVCRSLTVSNRIDIEVIEEWNSQDTCDNMKLYYNQRNVGEQFVYDSSNCNYKCDEWLNNLDSINYTAYKINIENENELEQYKDFNYKFSQKLDKIHIEINSNLSFPSSQYKIINLQGIELISQNIFIKKGRNEFDINIENYQNGFYILLINIENQEIISSKFIILR